MDSALSGKASRRGKAHLRRERGLVCLDVSDPPHTGRISRRGKAHLRRGSEDPRALPDEHVHLAGAGVWVSNREGIERG